MQEPDLYRYPVVLARAEEAGNVGSVCRAMKTMGFPRLILAGCPDYDEDRIRTMSVHAFDIYEQALRFPDLASAVAGASLVAGFTRRRGERRKSFSVSVADFSRELAERRSRGAGGELALVFGNERTGLTGEELELCSLAVHIPTSEAFPSLNLSQAVQIACYELRKEALGERQGSYAPVARAEVDAMVERAADRLRELGFFRLNQGEELRHFLRDLCERAALSPAELRYLESFIHKMAGLAGRGGDSA
jgi:TrmH family RNA methyltransferase